MNKVILMGRPTKDPEIRNSSGVKVARYYLAVDRRFSKDREPEQTADFIPCVAFGTSADFAEKWIRQGKKIMVTGRIQTGSYVNRDGQKVYTVDVVVEEQEFVESKAAESNSRNERSTGTGNGYSGSSGRGTSNNRSYQDTGDGFMNIPDGVDEELPFN